jgi:peptide-methionine (S)-S-oxide reductase
MENKEIAYLAGGCFWCLEAVFQRVPGVLKVRSGYSGGKISNPTYEQVSEGSTGHAETVEISYDPKVITYETLLDIFFDIHDPTTLNQQGADIGTQYRSVIFVISPTQFSQAMKKVAELTEKHKFPNPIVTQIVKFEEFFRAEDYHQDFYNQNPNYPYCRIVIDPKLRKLIDIQKNINNIL